MLNGSARMTDGIYGQENMVAMTEVADHLDVVEYAGRSLMQVDEEAGVALSLVGFEVFCVSGVPISSLISVCGIS